MKAASHSAPTDRRLRGSVPSGEAGDDSAAGNGLADPINILIVDDEPVNLTVLETVLQDPGYKLVRAESADQALLALMAQEFALLILDVRMPSLTGFELAALIKQRKKTEQIPIIFLTAYYNEDQHVLEGYSTGAVDYLHKPINATVLRSKVGIFANLYRQARELERINRRLGEEATERREAQRELQELNRTLEQRVKARTADLVERTRVLESAQQQLRAGAAQFQGLADAAPGFIWSTDAHGRFTFMSRRFELFTGLSLDQLREDWQRVLHPEDSEAATRQFLAAIRDHSPLSGRVRLRRADGVYRWIESSAVPLLDQQAEPAASFRGLIGMSMDNSDLVSAEQALREADQRKDEFLATLAHELRNPLAPVRNAVQILRTQEGAGPAARKLQDIIDRQIGQMARIVDDLLDVSRISQGKLELRRGRVTLQQIIQSAVETSGPLIDQNDHQLEVVLPEKSLVLDADLTRLSQVFANLLNNAAKFTEASGRIKLVAEEDGAEVVVSVSDSGVGIPGEQMARLFELFSQGQGAPHRLGGGLGIGLSLVKQLVELHHGRVTGHSGGLGLGSEFTVRLPLALDQSLSAAADSGHPPAARERAARLRILVVDDSEDAALTLATLLELSGYELYVAHDGEQALEVAESTRPDVVLLDIGLPNMNGNEVCQRFRQLEWGRQMTVIALTGWGQEQDRRRTTESGFDLHLVKPADPVALLKLLEGIAA